MRPKEATTMQLIQQRQKAIVLHEAVPLHGTIYKGLCLHEGMFLK